MKTNPRAIGYWAATGLVAAAFLVGGAVELTWPPAAVAGMRALGYPSYFLTILGVWKVLSAPALLARAPA